MGYRMLTSRLVEVGPRDGLQNISGPPVPTHTKLELVNRLLDSGVKVVEAGSFVRPDRVPQVRPLSNSTVS
jgi:hydroxymethylglutaryl-CoA lyase